MSTAQDLVLEIEKLSPAEKVRLIDRVIRDTIKPDTEIEQIWAKEAESRWESFDCGEIDAISYNSVISKYRNK